MSINSRAIDKAQDNKEQSWSSTSISVFNFWMRSKRHHVGFSCSGELNGRTGIAIAFESGSGKRISSLPAKLSRGRDLQHCALRVLLCAFPLTIITVTHVAIGLRFRGRPIQGRIDSHRQARRLAKQRATRPLSAIALVFFPHVMHYYMLFILPEKYLTKAPDLKLMCFWILHGQGCIIYSRHHL